MPRRGAFAGRSARSARRSRPARAAARPAAAAPTNSSRYCAERRQQLRQQHDDERADERTEHALGAAEHHDQQEQDRLEERKRFRADEIADRGEHAAGKSRPRPPRCAKAVVRISVGSRPIDWLADFGIAHRAHGVAPRARARAARKATIDTTVSASDEKCDAALADLGAEHGAAPECPTGRSSRRSDPATRRRPARPRSRRRS